MSNFLSFPPAQSIYAVTFSGVSVSAPQDLVQINCPSGYELLVLGYWLADVDTTLPTAQQLQLRCSFMPAVVTNGSGGTAATIGNLNTAGLAAAFTAFANNTTKATTTGTPSVLDSDGCYLYNGIGPKQFPVPVPVNFGQSFVFELLSTPSGTLTLSGGLYVNQIHP